MHAYKHSAVLRRGGCGLSLGRRLSDLQLHKGSQVSYRRPQKFLLTPSSLSIMILYLLFPALTLSFVGSQTVNKTEEELSIAEGNQTFSKSIDVNSTIEPGNVTSSLYKDERSRIESEIQSKQTSTDITEDNENFQEQEKKFPARHCRQDQLVKLSHSECGTTFQREMLSIHTENWCVLEIIINPYNDMTTCLENLSTEVDCYYPNPDIQDFFLFIHSHYFQNCSREETVLVDAPHRLVLALTLVPVSLIPVLVYLAVWKSKDTE